MRADKLTGELLCGYGANSRPVAFGPITRQVRRPHGRWSLVYSTLSVNVKAADAEPEPIWRPI